MPHMKGVYVLERTLALIKASRLIRTSERTSVNNDNGRVTG